jgi:phosphonoacetate hydrolase
MTQSFSPSRISNAIVEVNGRTYAAPKRPTVVIVVDGFDPAYLEHGMANGTLPTMKSFKERGFMAIADCSMPSTTNTNNTSIVTGAPPVVHGINGNYYIDSETGEEVMVTDAKRLRCGTILGALSHVGVKAAVVTARLRTHASCHKNSLLTRICERLSIVSLFANKRWQSYYQRPMQYDSSASEYEVKYCLVPFVW